MHEAISAVKTYGFDIMKLNRQEAFTHKDNVASIRSLERNGLTRDFKLEEELRDDPELTNMIIYTITNENLDS
jgi:RimJ/RimL family protein N-acetyltransferase